jgi:uncharacterized protein YbjT (DUF2867 family)
MASIDARDIAAVAAAVLTKLGFEGVQRPAGPASVSNNYVANILSRVTGRSISYVSVPDTAVRQLMSGMGAPD